ncbi:MAG TPA: hypothetical protein VGN69_08695 [Solirubrobacteraceae bacterium]|nr:hypothetical protein [Solirubrobacteraceae bacterium]
MNDAHSPPPTGPAAAWARLRRFTRRHSRPITVGGSLLATAVLVAILAGRRHQFEVALTRASILTLLAAAALQLVALLARSEAWHVCIAAAGGTLRRRILYRASSMGYVGSLLNAQVGTAARIAALRRSSPGDSPGVSTLIAAEFPIMAVEATLAALTSFTLVGPLGLPWWLPIVCVAVFAGLSAGLRHLALLKGRALWSGLAVLRSLHGGRRLLAFVLVAVFAQILRNWLLLNAVGVNASFLDAIAVLIAMVALTQLPIGPGTGAAAAVLILGRHGIAAVAAAGLLSTVTGTFGGLSFAAWAGADRLWSGSGAQATLRGHRKRLLR